MLSKKIHSVLLVSSDSTLIEPVRNAVHSVRGCRISVVGTGADCESQLDVLDPVLIVYHATEGDAGSAERLIGNPFFRNKPVATVVVRDRHDGEITATLLRSGVVDVLVRPLDLRRLVFLIESLTLRVRYTASSAAQSSQPAASGVRDPGWMHCGSPAVAGIAERLQRVAKTDATVLLTGETGSGKSRFAKLVHDTSPRSHLPFLVINCGALSPNLIESELFGHCRGAFSGADCDRIGKFEAAGQGTLFLDDVEALPLEVQGRLLRAIDERVFERVGSNRLQQIEARIVVASNKDLVAEVAADRFREDLYFRLNVVEFRVPPLRSRREDIPPLAAGFLERFAFQYGRPVPVLPPELLSLFETYDWPGNVRQLRNAMERVVTLSDAVVKQDDLPIELQEPAAAAMDVRSDRLQPVKGPAEAGHYEPVTVRHGSSPPAIEAPLAAAEEELSDGDLLDSAAHPWVKPLSALARARLRGEVRKIIEALNVTKNNRSLAARELGISRVALYKKLHKYGLMDLAGE